MDSIQYILNLLDRNVLNMCTYYDLAMPDWYSRSFSPKTHFWTFWIFSAWKLAKLAPIYLEKHLQHDSMPLFPLAPKFYSSFARPCAEIKISFFDKTFFLLSFCAFPYFSHFLIFLLQWLTFCCRACFQFKKIQLGNSVNQDGQIAKSHCSRRQFCSEFFGQTSEHFPCIFQTFQAPLSRSLWSGYHSSCRTWG